MMGRRSFFLVSVATISLMGSAVIAQDQPVASADEPVVVEAAPAAEPVPAESPAPVAETPAVPPQENESAEPSVQTTDTPESAPAPVVEDSPPPVVQDSAPAPEVPETHPAPATESVDSAPSTPSVVQGSDPAPVAASPEAPADAPAAEGGETASTPAPAATDATANPEPVIPLPALSEDVPAEKALLGQLRLRKPPIDIEKMPSLFLTVWERDLVINARKGQLARDPDAPEDVAEVPVDDKPNIYESPRDLRLSGIVYRSSKDWVIWLNAKRIAPNAIPREIMDIKVYKDYIELEWFDATTNQIFPVRLRPQQRFNLDARIFLPG